jgi:acyl-CoA reductase-like NAD-dependent aldehyde dehydrogenase
MTESRTAFLSLFLTCLPFPSLFSFNLMCLNEGLSEAGVEDVEIAVRAARAAFEGPWHFANTSPSQRGQLLYKLADLIEQHRAEYALLESMDVGKPIAESFNFDLTQIINAFRYYAGNQHSF